MAGVSPSCIFRRLFPLKTNTFSRSESRFTITFQQLGENGVINRLICRAVVKWDHLLGGHFYLFESEAQHTHAGWLAGWSGACLSNDAARMQSKSCLLAVRLNIWHSLCFVEARRSFLAEVCAPSEI